MTIETYNAEVNEIAHFTNDAGRRYIIINQTYWYSADEYTDETAAAAYMKVFGLHGLKNKEGRKAAFVRVELSALLRKADNGITQATYTLHNSGEETVNVYYRNGTCKKIQVTDGDFADLARDVMRQI